MSQLLKSQPKVEVADSEYKRLLGYPPQHQMTDRAAELAVWARAWYETHGNPWVYARLAEEIAVDSQGVVIDGEPFFSAHLRKIWQQTGVHTAVVAAVTAGRECELHARRLWEEGKPDEYFFLEIYGSAVVESLITDVGAQLCAWAIGHDITALPHYSPGYGEWDVSEQNALLRVLNCGTGLLGGRIDVLESGMLRPKKSLLAVFGLTRHMDKVAKLSNIIPCECCSLGGCQYRRAPYRRAIAQLEDVGKLQGKMPDVG